MQIFPREKRFKPHKGWTKFNTPRAKTILRILADLAIMISRRKTEDVYKANHIRHVDTVLRTHVYS